MNNNAYQRRSWRVPLPNEGATRALAGQITALVGAGDLLTLSGELGSGKTTFARYLIRLLLGDEGLEVPSPTYTLMQIYEGPSFPIVHADLYRLRGPDELSELGWDEASEGALVLVEWVDRAGDRAPADRLDIEFCMTDDNSDGARIAHITPYGGFEPRLQRILAIHDLLQSTGWADARRVHMTGDASARSYERLVKPGGSALLMISPARRDGPAIRAGKPYSALAHLAEDIRPFIAIGGALAELGLSAPRILGVDMESGLAVLEDLGPGLVVNDNGPIVERYAEAVAVLARLHSQDLPSSAPLPDGTRHVIPRYDLQALLIEAELLIDWYAIESPASNFDSISRIRYNEMWTRALKPLEDGHTTWTLRDYHSPNLIWLPAREGMRRVGVIDFQDCVIGHPAYDLVSLLQDARVTVPNAMELRLLTLYAQLRRGQGENFDMSSFARAYALLGAQRATKILGIFARLDRRDQKPQYLQHIPRVETYLAKNLEHPALAEVKAWYKANVPHIFA